MPVFRDDCGVLTNKKYFKQKTMFYFKISISLKGSFQFQKIYTALKISEIFCKNGSFFFLKPRNVVLKWFLSI